MSQPTTRAALITQCAATIVALTAPTLSTPPNGGTSHELDGLVLVDDAAKMLATSADTLYSKWKKLPFANNWLAQLEADIAANEPAF